VLVAGGIGISPFVAILRDLLHRYQRGQPNLPSTVHLIWAVQKSEELQLLDLIPASTICPDYKLNFNLQVHAFVTRETSAISLERGSETSDLHQPDEFKRPRILASLNTAEASKHPMSIVAGAGSNMWITACFLASLLGYIIIYLLIKYFIVLPFENKSAEDKSSSDAVPRWVTGLFNVISMMLGVVVFGGSVVSLWNFFGRLHQGTSGAVEESVHLLSASDSDETAYADECADRLVHPSNTYFGHRPNLRGKGEVSLN
jgi:ferric-chelate reductase